MGSLSSLCSYRNVRSPFLDFHALSRYLSDKLDDTAGLGDLALSLGADVSRADDDRDLGETACVVLVFSVVS